MPSYRVACPECGTVVRVRIVKGNAEGSAKCYSCDNEWWASP